MLFAEREWKGQRCYHRYFVWLRASDLKVSIKSLCNSVKVESRLQCVIHDDTLWKGKLK